MHRKDPSTNHFHLVTFSKDNRIKIVPSTMNPSKTLSYDSPWLFVDNNKINDTVTTSNAGKWIMFVDNDVVDDIWLKIKKEVEKGNLCRAKVATVNPDYDNHVLFVYVHNSADLKSIKLTYETLVKAEIVHPDEIIKFVTDKQTFSKQFGKNLYLYSSQDIQNLNDQQLEFIYNLSNYRLIRGKEWTLSKKMFNSFFGMLTGMSASVKLSAVDKMLKLIRGVEDEEDKLFTWDEIAALRDGRLGKHLSNYEKLNCLPKEFIRAEQEKIQTISHYMSMR